jgi:hypothetical protein
MSQELRETFVVPQRTVNEPEHKYLERIFGLFEARLTREVAYLSEGHQQTITCSEDGSTDVLIKPEHRVTNVLVKPEVGAGAYVYNLELTENREQDNKEGDQVTIYFRAPASTNPTIKVKDQDGTIIDSISFTGTGNDNQRKTYTKADDVWKV